MHLPSHNRLDMGSTNFDTEKLSSHTPREERRIREDKRTGGKLCHKCPSVRCENRMATAALSSPSRFPVESRATASVMNATSTGILIPERTLGRDPKRDTSSGELEPAWFKVTKSPHAHAQRFGTTLRDSLTKTQSSVDAPAFLQIPEVGTNSCDEEIG